MRRRTFIAVWPPEAVQREIEQRLAAHVPHGWRRPDARDLHVTLMFLGDVEDEIVGELDRRLTEVAARHARLEWVLEGTGAFPTRARPRILWVGVRELGGARAAELQSEVERACVELGFAREERPWSPHLTLARAPRGAGPAVPESFFAQDFRVSWQPAELARVLSHAGSAREVGYEVVARFPLGRSPSA